MPDKPTSVRRALYRYPDGATCSIEGCDKRPYSRGWCLTHYTRWYERGNPLTVLPKPGRTRSDSITRFWGYVDTTGDCLLWTGASVRGYGVYGIGYIKDGTKRQVKAHCFAWTQVFGPVPDGMILDHLCRTPLCVHPGHLEPVTERENTLRGIGPSAQNAMKRFCKRGHEFTSANTYIASDQSRHCRTCRNDQARERRRK